MNKSKISVLYVDDKKSNLTSFITNFKMKYNVLTALNELEAKKILANNNIAIIIVNQQLSDMNGVEYLKKNAENYTFPIPILITSPADVRILNNAVNKGEIFHYLTAPWKEENLIYTIERAYSVFVQKQKIHAIEQKLKCSQERLELLLRERF